VSLIYYVSTSGKDSNPGTQARPWKTPRAVSNATVFLAAGQKFDANAASPISFAGLTNATITSDPNNPATVVGAAMQHGQNIGPNMFAWSAESTNCTLSNIIVDSVDGNGFGGLVRGTNISIGNVQLHNLAEGFDWQGVNGVTILSGKQTGRVLGRCHYFLGCIQFNISTDVMGPSVAQSPIRFSTDVGGPYVNNKGGTVSIPVTQVGSPDPIACFAIHNAVDVTFKNCFAVGGEFSFDGAGAGVGDNVTGCNVVNLTVSGSKLNLNTIAFNNTFTNFTGSNATGEVISCQTVAKAGNVVNGGTLTSPVHGIHMYSANDTVFKNLTYNRDPSRTAPLMDGLFTGANDGGGNVIK